MLFNNIKESDNKSRQTSGPRSCPQCGGKTIEVDRCREKGILYVWLECEREDCHGQWLQKNPQ